MIKYSSASLIILGLLLLAQPLRAQFINMQLTVEPEITATVERSLDFGTQITNSGRTEIQIGDANMGVFKIRAIHTQNLYISLEYPDALTIEEPGITAQIPLELNLAYNNSGTDSPFNSSQLPANNGFVSVHESTQDEFDDQIWKEMFVYVYGSIIVGNIPNGTYSGEIVLSIDYD